MKSLKSSALFAAAAFGVFAMLFAPVEAPAASDQAKRYIGSTTVSNDLQREVTLGTIYFFPDGSGIQTAIVSRVIVTDETLTTNVADTVTNSLILATMVYSTDTSMVLDISFPAGYAYTLTDKALTTNTIVITRPEM